MMMLRYSRPHSSVPASVQALSPPPPLCLSLSCPAATKCHTPSDPFDTPDQFGSPCYDESAVKRRQGESRRASTTSTIIKLMFYNSVLP